MFVTFVTGKKMAQNFFSLLSFGVITLSVFSIRYFCYADFYMDQEKSCYCCFIFNMKRKKQDFSGPCGHLFHIANVAKADLSFDFPFLTFVTFVTGNKMAWNFFMLPLFLLKSSLSVCFPDRLIYI